MSINDNDETNDDHDDHHVDNHRRKAYVNIWRPMFVSFQCQARTVYATFVLSVTLSLPLSLPPFFLSQLASIIFVLSLSAHAVKLLYLPRLVYTNDSHRVDLLVCLSVLSPYIDKNHFKSTSFVPLCCDSAHRVSHYD